MRKATSQQASALAAATQALNQLERILSSARFADSPRLSQFLRYVVGEMLEGRSDRIKGFTVAQEVFGRDDPEDAQTSTIVRVEARRLRRRLDEYYASEGEKDELVISIPKGTYAPNLTSRHALDAKTAPAAAFVDTGGKTNSGLDQSTIRRLLVLAVVVIGAGALLWFSTSFMTKTKNPLSGYDRPAIAVLPIENLTNDPRYEQLAMGLTEGIITGFSKVSGLDVIAYPSIMKLKGQNLTPEVIAEKLSVSHILRGSLRGSKSKLRITAQFIDARTNKQIWAESFDRVVDDELELEAELALKVAESISLRFNSNEWKRLGRGYTQNAEAYALYKQTLNIANPPSDRGRLQIAAKGFQRVIELDPKFAGGYAGAAYVSAFKAMWGHVADAQAEAREALLLSRKAKDIDPSFGLTYNAESFAYLVQREYDKALSASERAIELQPNDPYVSTYHAFLLCSNGQSKLGISYAQRALRLDPLQVRTPYLNILGVVQFHAGEFDYAIDAFQRNIDRGGPINLITRVYMTATLAALERFGEARKTLATLKEGPSVEFWKKWLQRNFREKRDIEFALRYFHKAEKGGS